MFEKPALDVEDGASYGAVRSAVEAAFAPVAVDRYLRQVASRRLRVREFEAVLAQGLLGQEAAAAYGRLGNLDRGQARELYLKLVEQVAPALRARHLKVYAYY